MIQRSRSSMGEAAAQARARVGGGPLLTSWLGAPTLAHLWDAPGEAVQHTIKAGGWVGRRYPDDRMLASGEYVCRG
jgi:hypothetical protein